ncbi:MAG: 2-oxoacid:acceptor oxidoreductase family protein [Promethearchaeota archaeon]
MDGNGKAMVEVVIHGRGGQGAVTAALLIGKIAIEDGWQDMISIPIIGAERRGAAIRANLRISREEIKIYASITDPDVVLVFDESLLLNPLVKQSIKDCKLLVNTETGVDASEFPGCEVYTIDATGASLALNLLVAGDPVLNVPMIGAFARMTGYIKLDSIEKIVKKEWGPSKLDLNMQAARKAYDELKRVN